MQTQCYLTTVTMTLAMKGKRILERNRIAATVSRLPPPLTKSGCAFGIVIDCDLIEQARKILQQAEFAFGKLLYADGTPVGEGLRKASPSVVTGTPRTTVSKGGTGR